MKKKGVQLGLQAVIIATLGLVVLIILIMIIRGQLTKGTARYTNISLEAEKEFRAGNRCAVILSGRFCSDACTAPSYKQVPGTYEDCKGSKKNCCEPA